MKNKNTLLLFLSLFICNFASTTKTSGTTITQEFLSINREVTVMATSNMPKKAFEKAKVKKLNQLREVEEQRQRRQCELIKRRERLQDAADATAITPVTVLAKINSLQDLGFSRDEVQQEMTEQGYSQESINSALVNLKQEESKSSKKKAKNSTPTQAKKSKKKKKKKK